MAQRVQPGQGLCGADPDGGPQRAADGRTGPEAPVDHQHGGVLLHEEPAALHLPEPPEAGVVALPQHQVGPVHPLQPLHQVQQGSTGPGEGAARAEPALPAAVQRLTALPRQRGLPERESAAPTTFAFSFRTSPKGQRSRLPR